MTKSVLRRWAPWGGIVIGLCTVTVAFFVLAPRYQPTGPDLLSNPGFQNGFAGWRIDGPASSVTAGQGVVSLANDDTSQQIGLRQTVVLPEGVRAVRLHGESAANRLRAGTKQWHSARIYIVPNDAAGSPLWDSILVLESFRRDGGWRAQETVLEVPEGPPSVTVGLQLAWTSGEMHVRGLSLVPVAIAPFAAPVERSLMAAWAVALIAVGWRLWRAFPDWRERLTLAVPVGLALGGILMPQEIKQPIVNALLGPGDPMSGRSPEGPGGIFAPVPVEAYAHYLMFALMALLLRRLRPAESGLAHATGFALLAAVSEVLQFFSVGRTPRIVDWLIDMGGVATGFLIAALIRRWRFRARRRRMGLPRRARSPGV